MQFCEQRSESQSRRILNTWITWLSIYSWNLRKNLPHHIRKYLKRTKLLCVKNRISHFLPLEKKTIRIGDRTATLTQNWCKTKCFFARKWERLVIIIPNRLASKATEVYTLDETRPRQLAHHCSDLSPTPEAKTKTSSLFASHRKWDKSGANKDPIHWLILNNRKNV